MWSRIASVTLSVIGLSGVALAQTNQSTPGNAGSVRAEQPTAQSKEGTTGVAAAPGPVGFRIADSANMAVRFADVKPADFTASKLLGIDVFNNQNEELGEIEDVVFEDGKSISGIVVSVGGFLGLGEHYVVLDPSTVVVSQKDGTWRAYVNTTKESLENAPKFTYGEAE